MLLSPDPVDKLRRSRLRGLIRYHSGEVDPMLDRLASVHPVDALRDAVTAVLQSGTQLNYVSQLEAMLLAHLGAGDVNTSPDPARARALAEERRNRRVRGLACPACYDSGWALGDDDTAHRCECVGGPGVSDPRPPPPQFTPAREWVEPDTAYEAIAQARRILNREEP